MAETVSIIITAVIVYFIIKVLMGGQDGSNNNSGSGGSQLNPLQRGRHLVTREKVDQVLAMFPDYSREIIEADLSRTGSVESTCENILSGILPHQPPPQPRQSSTTTTTAFSALSSASTSSSSSLKQQVVPKRNPLLDSIDTNTKLDSAPEKVWEDDPKQREQHLRQRKQWMLQQQRQKFLEKQKGKGKSAL